MLLGGPALVVQSTTAPIPPTVPDDIWLNPLGYVYAPLPTSVALDPASSSCVTELAAQAGLNLPNINTFQFTAKINVLPADHPLTPVRLDRTESDPVMSELRARFAAGTPIAAG